MSNNKITCPACKNQIEQSEVCPLCAFPFNGTEMEKAKHIGRFINKKGVIVDSADSLKVSRNFILVAAGFFFIGFVVNFEFLVQSLLLFFIELGVIVILLGCALLLKHKPLLFLSIPLALLLMIYIFQLWIDEMMFLRGIIFKVLILGSLIYSMYLHLTSNKFKRKFNI